MKLKNTLKSIKEFRVYRRNLPHFELPGSVYFITFSTDDEFTLSDSAKDIVFSAFKFHAGKKYKLHACVVMDTHVHCVLQPLMVKKAQTGMSVPPNTQETEKIRLPVPPGAFYSLAEIMHSIKSYSSNQINRSEKREGSIWQDENYDRVIRDEVEYSEKMNYIINNPTKEGLIEKPQDYKWLFYEGME